MATATWSKSREGLKPAILRVTVGLAFALALIYYKKVRIDQFVRRHQEVVQAPHQQITDLFKSTFYFFYEDQFVPGITRQIEQIPELHKLEIISSGGETLFDSEDLGKPLGASRARGVVTGDRFSHVKSGEPAILTSGFTVQLLRPAGDYAIVYEFRATQVRNEIVLALIVGAFIVLTAAWGIGYLRRHGYLQGHVLWGLRGKFIFTMILINLITGGIIFWSVSELQTKEETERIQRESILFSQFSTPQVVSDFSSFFYFDYTDKFIPAIKRIIAANRNLILIRVVSKRSGSILFEYDPDRRDRRPPSTADNGRIELTPEAEGELNNPNRRLFVRRFLRGADPLLSVVTSYWNEEGESLFYVEYLFSFATLQDSIDKIRDRIKGNLIPSMVLGVLIAIFFAGLLIAPLRRLMTALQKVKEGDYNVTVEAKGTDEIYALISAFNGMTSELRKKKELQKFLSESTYRQIMAAFENSSGTKVGGTRAEATILFSDIRNFVQHCENLEAEEVTAMLNDYFSEMVDVVHKHGGEVDKFIGDALLAVFYSPEGTSTETALQAVYCALEMKARLADFNARRSALNQAQIEIGVGISHGEVISGPIGAKDRMDFTVIGDVVNLASRIEKLSKEGRHLKIVFSHHVEERVRGLLEYELMSNQEIRGKNEAVSVYELIRLRDLEAVIDDAQGKDLKLKLGAIELLGLSRNPQALPFLLQSLRDGDEGVRIRAVVALSRLCAVAGIALDPVIDAILDRLPGESSDKVISSLISAVGQICRDERMFRIARFLDHPQDRVVANTVEALGQFRHPKVVDIILPMLASANNRVKANAALALFNCGQVIVLDTLRPMLMYSDPLMRSSAAFAIGELSVLTQKDELIAALKSNTPNATRVLLAKLQECVPMLVGLLRDPEPAVKRQAIIALGKIKDRSSVLPLIDNIDPTKDSAEMLHDVADALRAIGSHRLVREVIGKLS